MTPTNPICGHCGGAKVEYKGYVNEGYVYWCKKCERHTRYEKRGKQPVAAS